MSLHFLIDGWNIANQVELLKANRGVTESSQALVRFIQSQRLLGSRNNLGTIVFDGWAQGSGAFGGRIKVMFSKGDCADEVIKRLIEQAPNPRQMVVVTDDKEIRFYCRRQGAGLLSVEQFLKRPTRQIKGANKHCPGPGLSKARLSLQQEEDINRHLRQVWS